MNLYLGTHYFYNSFTYTCTYTLLLNLNTNMKKKLRTVAPTMEYILKLFLP